MKKSMSASPALLVTAMMVTVSFGCGEGIEGATGSQSAQLNQGQCNAIVARALGTSQKCSKFGCSPEECIELQDTFNEFFVENPDCAAAFFAGELNGLGGNALIGPDGESKHIQEVICGAAEACDPTCENIQAVGLCLNTEACSDEDDDTILFGVDEGLDELIQIDPSTGAATSIGPVGPFASISSLASDSEGVLFGTDTFSKTLVTLDRRTGAASSVGPTGVGEITGLAFADDGTLFGAESLPGPGQLVRIDPTTGISTRVGPIGFELVTGLAFDPNGTLFGVVGGGTVAVDSVLLLIDTTSGAATAVGTLDVPFVTGLSFDEDGTLFGVSRGTNELLTVDTVTAEASVVGPLGGGERFVGGISFAEANDDDD